MPWSLWSCAIAGYLSVEWIPWRIMLRKLTSILAWTSGEEEEKSTLRWPNSSVHAISTAWLLFRVSHLHSAARPGPNSDGTVTSQDSHVDSQWWTAIVVRAMNVRLIYQTMIFLSFPFVICHRGMSSEWDPQFQSLQFKTCTSKLIIKITIKQAGNFEYTSETFVGCVMLSLANSQATIVRISVE